MHFTQEYGHNGPQGRSNEKEFELYSNTTINITNQDLF